MRVIALTLLCCLLFSGCTLFVKDPELTVRKLSVASFNMSGAKIDMLLSVTNPNPFAIRLIGYNYDLKLNSLQLAKAEVREETKFPAGAATEIHIPINVTIGDMLVIFSKKLDLEALPYTLLAEIELDTPLGVMKLPLSHSGSYALPHQYRPSRLLNRVGDLLK